MKIALAQFNPVVGDFAGNAARIVALSKQAASRGAELAIFSEMCVCGYPPQDLIERPAFLARNLETLQRLARQVALPVIVGYVGKAQEATGKAVANCAALLAAGSVAFEQRKMLLPTYDVFDESRYFQPADSQAAAVFCGARLGITVCEDIWNDKSFWRKPLYPRDPVQELMGQGIDLLINISASPYQLDKRNLRLDMLRALARRHGRPVVYVNQVGGNDSLIFDGSSVALAPGGRVAAQAHSFEEDLVLFDTADHSGDIRTQPADELEAAYRALVCGTRDYVRKCGFSAVALGLSGGIDSAVVACIAAEAVGPENVLGVSMPGPFSSPGSTHDAQALAQNLGIRLFTLPITEAYESYLRALQPAFEGRPRDVTEENIQARIRGNFLMALSNKLGALVLTTGNKSELAVGYCTLYGDMAGGLAVISDVPKTMVYALAEFINRQREVIPRSSLQKPPSAELRPNQTDQDTLPAYDVLDRIIKAYVEELKSPEEIAARYDFDLALVRRLAAQIDRSEYKRKQAAPGLKITSKAFAIGRPFPLAHKFLP
jgi:NAD+ synthase/NAD+ synthase (glutamine-hydrolysing)